VGSLDDPHCKAVATEIGTYGSSYVVLDAASVTHTVRWTTAGLYAADGSTFMPTRAWIRRVVPTDWHLGVVGGSSEAAILGSKVSLLAAVLRTPAIQWLTSIDSMMRAENKLVQYQSALAAGLQVPQTITTGPGWSNVASGDDWVVKSLGPGHFVEGGQGYVVFTQSIRGLDGSVLVELEEAPFILQKRLIATRHLRIVTVRRRAWACELAANGVPLDWRSDSRAHASFVASKDDRLIDPALRIAGEMGLGYTSQDWIETEHGLFFVDLNPSGQWLFLPETVARQVTTELASWLISK
jgi:hypothetical protein